MRRLAAIGAFVLASAPAALACPVCFQVEQGPLTSGVRAAVIVLMAVTVSVLSGFAFFIRSFVRRSAEPRNPGTPEPRNPL